MMMSPSSVRASSYPSSAALSSTTTERGLRSTPTDRHDAQPSDGHPQGPPVPVSSTFNPISSHPGAPAPAHQAGSDPTRRPRGGPPSRSLGPRSPTAGVETRPTPKPRTPGAWRNSYTRRPPPETLEGRAAVGTRGFAPGETGFSRCGGAGRRRRRRPRPPAARARDEQDRGAALLGGRRPRPRGRGGLADREFPAGRGVLGRVAADGQDVRRSRRPSARVVSEDSSCSERRRLRGRRRRSPVLCGGVSPG